MNVILPPVLAGPGLTEGAGSPVSDNETAEAPTVGEYDDRKSETLLTQGDLFAFIPQPYTLYRLESTELL